MNQAFEIVVIKFRDVPDVINHRECFRVFQTRFFNSDNKQDVKSAMMELYATAEKQGFTDKDIIKIERAPVKIPL